MRQKSAVLVLCLGLVLSFLASCTRSKEVTPPKENVFRMAIKSKFTTLDPHYMTDVYSISVAGLVIENLYEYHPLKRPLELIPLLADGMPTVSKDFKTFTFKLKKGIKYQDNPCFKATGGKGREFTAQDVEYSVYRISSPKKVSPGYSSYEDLLEGVNAYHAGKTDKISGLKVIDDHTIQFKLVRPSPRFVFNFTDPRSAPQPKECVEALGDDQMATTLIGTGPYKLVEYDPNSKAVAVRNPDYHTVTYPSDASPQFKDQGLLADAGKPLPIVDKVIYEVLQEDLPRWLKFKAGEHDVIRIPKDNIGSALPNGQLAEDLAKIGVRHVREVEADVTCWIFNLKTPVWGEKKELRQAFSLALDREKLIRLNYADQAIPAQSLIDPTMYGYDAKWRSKYATRDVAKAKALLAKAGYPDGKGLPVLEMPHGSSSPLRQVAEAVQRDLAEAGIKTKLISMSWPELSTGLRKGKWMVTGLGYMGSSPDVDNMTGLYHSKNLAPGSNVANYKNPEVDKLIDEIDSMQNGPARMAKIKRFRDLIDEDMAYIPGVHRIGNHLVHRWVKNYTYTDESLIGQWMKYKRIETAAEAKGK